MPTLFIIATPIGNLGDISPRAVELLLRLSLLACEDTRRAAKLLAHLGAQPRLVRYDEHVHEQATRQVLSALESGQDVGLISDAGTPGMSDPGARLVGAVADAGFTVLPIPGPSALAAILSIAGFPCTRFSFEGFLPPRGTARRNRLSQLVLHDCPFIFYESPKRIRATMVELAELMPAAHAVMGRELSKLHESVYRFCLSEKEKIEALPELGEYAVIINPISPPPSREEKEAILASALLLAREMRKKGSNRRAAAKAAAEHYKLRVNDIYRLMEDGSA